MRRMITNTSIVTSRKGLCSAMHFTFHDSGLLRDLAALAMTDGLSSIAKLPTSKWFSALPSSDNSSLLVTKPASCSFWR